MKQTILILSTVVVFMLHLSCEKMLSDYKVVDFDYPESLPRDSNLIGT